MALTDKEYEKFYKETGSGDDKITAANKDYAKTAFEYGATHGFSDIVDDYRLGPIVYMMQQMQDELDYLRTEISTNKSKATFPGLGTSGSTALAGDTTTISTAQASAITANTAKTGITTQQTSAITANEKAVSNNASAITTNATSIASAIKVSSYPPPPLGATQSHNCEVVYNTRNKTYFLVFYYVEEVPGKGGGKATRTVRTGQIQLT